MPPVLTLQRVGAFYWRQLGFLKRQRFWALHDVSFELRRGESLGIVGRNGAGKSTLLQLLAGIIRPDRGELINHGVSVSLLSLQLGFIPYLTGRQNAILSGMLLGAARQKVEAQLEAIRAFSELGEFFDQPTGSYSSGMRARLGFAVAFQLEPDVLLIDEVLGVGDEAFRAKSTRAIKDKIRSDKTIVLVSHNANTIRELCDKAVWIEKGVSRCAGEVRTVLQAYQQSLTTPTASV